LKDTYLSYIMIWAKQIKYNFTWKL